MVCLELTDHKHVECSVVLQVIKVLLTSVASSTFKGEFLLHKPCRLSVIWKVLRAMKPGLVLHSKAVPY